MDVVNTRNRSGKLSENKRVARHNSKNKVDSGQKLGVLFRKIVILRNKSKTEKALKKRGYN